jgi:hypothetical protein
MDIPGGSEDGGLEEFLEFISKSRSSFSVRFSNIMMAFSTPRFLLPTALYMHPFLLNHYRKKTAFCLSFLPFTEID